MSLCLLSYLGGVLDHASAISCGSDAVTCPVTGRIITGYHGKQWTCNQSAFKLPATHVFWSKSGSAPSAEKGLLSAPSTATSGVSKGQLCGLISQYKTETEDGTFASFLNEFEGLILGVETTICGHSLIPRMWGSISWSWRKPNWVACKGNGRVCNRLTKNNQLTLAATPASKKSRIYLCTSTNWTKRIAWRQPSMPIKQVTSRTSPVKATDPSFYCTTSTATLSGWSPSKIRQRACSLPHKRKHLNGCKGRE